MNVSTNINFMLALEEKASFSRISTDISFSRNHNCLDQISQKSSQQLSNFSQNWWTDRPVLPSIELCH